VPGTGDEEDKFGETGGADGGGDFAELFVGGFGIEAEDGRGVGREGEAERGQNAERECSGCRERGGGGEEGRASDFLRVEWEAEAVVGEAVDGEDDDSALAVGDVGEVVPGAVGPGGGGIGGGEPGGAHVSR
jgi:hypothetical protein